MALQSSVRSASQLEIRNHEPSVLDHRINGKLCLLYAKYQIVGDVGVGVREIESSLCVSLCTIWLALECDLILLSDVT